MTVNFRSIFDVTYSEWLEGLGITEAEIPDVVILEGSWWREDRQKDRLSYLENVRELNFPDIFWGKWKNKKIIFCMAYGAARAVEISHIFSFLGCKLVIQIGTCGGLQPHLAPGDIILPDEISCEDGVSEHYLNDTKINANEEWIARSKELLTKRGCNIHVGKHVTFSSLFAETVEMYKFWHSSGFLSVEMETAATLAAASGLASNPTKTTSVIPAPSSASQAPSAILSLEAKTALILGLPVIMSSITDIPCAVSQFAGNSATVFIPHSVKPL